MSKVRATDGAATTSAPLPLADAIAAARELLDEARKSREPLVAIRGGLGLVEEEAWLFVGELERRGAREIVESACARLPSHAVLQQYIDTGGDPQIVRALRAVADAITWGRDRGYPQGYAWLGILIAIAAHVLPLDDVAGALDAAQVERAPPTKRRKRRTSYPGDAAMLEALSDVAGLDGATLRSRPLAEHLAGRLGVGQRRPDPRTVETWIAARRSSEEPLANNIVDMWDGLKTPVAPPPLRFDEQQDGAS